MINFPFFQHFCVKLVFLEDVDIDEKLIDKTADLMINALGLKVVNSGKHEFTNNGFTKFWVLSQSHLVIHSWPENFALHLDLMTCSSDPISSKTIEDCLSSLPLNKIIVTKLEY